MGEQLQTPHPHPVSQMHSTLHTLHGTQEVSLFLFHFDFNATIVTYVSCKPAPKRSGFLLKYSKVLFSKQMG